MSEHTKIEWCDDTHNFWRGCAKVPGRPGCANCYAEKLVTARLGGTWGKGAPRVRAKDFDAPIRWNKKPWVCDACGKASDGLARNQCDCGVKFHRRRVFSLSLGDWLDDEVPIEWLADMLDVIRRCPNLDFLLLTKRLDLFDRRLQDAINICERMGGLEIWLRLWAHEGTPPHNVWLGCSVENQAVADMEIPKLLAIPAVVRFLSCEPLLGPVNFDPRWLYTKVHNINWIIVGGESGPKARPCNVKWIQDIVRQCAAAAVPCFVKQLGSNPVHFHDRTYCPACDGAAYPLELHHPKGGDPAEWPVDLRVRQFPV